MYLDRVARARRGEGAAGALQHMRRGRFGEGAVRESCLFRAGKRADCAAERSEVAYGYVLVRVCV